MRFALSILLLLGIALFSPKSVFSSGLVYDADTNHIYLSKEVANYKEMERTRRFIGRADQEIFKLDIAKSKIDLFVKTDGQIASYSMSTQGYFAVSLYWFDAGKERRILAIFDGVGNKIKDIPDVPLSVSQDYAPYSWSPDGKSLVYVTAKETQDSKWGPFEPTGVWIYLVEKDEIIKIANKCFSVNWSAHDNNIYLQNRFQDTQSISVYDITMSELRKSTKKGLVFSDDGLYYLGSVFPENMEGSQNYVIYEGKSDKSVYQFKIGTSGGQEEWKDYAKFISGTHYLLMWSSGKFYQIFNVDNKSFLRKVKNKLLGWNKTMMKAVVYDEGKIHIDEMLAGKRLITLDVPGEF